MPYIEVGVQLLCSDHSHPMPYIHLVFQLPCVDNSHQMPLFQASAQLSRSYDSQFVNKIGQCKSVLTGCQQKSTTTRA